jgi:hypothetical protein
MSTAWPEPTLSTARWQGRGLGTTPTLKRKVGGSTPPLPTPDDQANGLVIVCFTGPAVAMARTGASASVGTSSAGVPKLCHRLHLSANTRVYCSALCKEIPKDVRLGDAPPGDLRQPGCDAC